MKNASLKKVRCLLFSVSFLVSMVVLAQTKVIAHRGYWNMEGVAQNSIASLMKAVEAEVYGSEFDVSITSDGVCVVNHDDDIQGRVIETSTYLSIKNLVLSNGEKLPTLEDYLKEGKKYPKIQMILEIKPHKQKLNENRAVKSVVKMVKKMKMKRQVEYISFSKNICSELVRLSPKSKIAYLGGDMTPDEVKNAGMTGIDYHLSVIYKNPEWIDQAHRNSLSVNVWTVDKIVDMKKLVGMKVDYLTTNKPIEALNLVK